MDRGGMTDKQAPASAVPPRVWIHPSYFAVPQTVIEAWKKEPDPVGGMVPYVPESVLSTARKEARAECAEMLEKAYRFLREGKAKFAPDTTNSRVDEWLADYEAQQARAGEGK